MQPTKRMTILAAATLLAVATASFGLGFRNPDQGARATGQGEAFVAQADDPSAVYYNPAGLAQLDGTHLMGGLNVMLRDYKFTGATVETMDEPAFLPHFYAATDLGQPKLRFGFGMNVPFGTKVDWGDAGSLRYVVTESELMVANFAPAIAWQVNEHLSIGGAVNVYYGDTELKRLFPWWAALELPPGALPDGVFRFEGDGVAVGGTIGLLWKINAQHSLGMVYRTPFSIDFDGTVGISLDPTPGQLFRTAPAEATIDFPQSVAVGYAFRPMKQLKLEVDIEWTNWETLDDVVLRSSNALHGEAIPFRWKNSFFYEFGVEYALNDQWVLRAGYIFSENTVPDETFSPTVPDSDRHVFSVGVGYATGRFGVDLVYQYSLSEDRTIRGGSVSSPFVDGLWETQAHALMLSVAARF